MALHKVVQGESIVTIATRYGFFWDTVWNHPENAALKTERENPNVLLPGDELFIPEKRLKTVSCRTNRKHKFRQKGIPALLEFRLLDAEGEPRSGVELAVEAGSAQKTLVTGDDGLISLGVPIDAKQAKVTIGEGDTAEEYTFDLGHLDPVDTTRGAKARLKNLGFYEGEIDDEIDDDTRKAIENFQESQGHEQQTGEMDKTTEDELQKAHVC